MHVHIGYYEKQNLSLKFYRVAYTHENFVPIGLPISYIENAIARERVNLIENGNENEYNELVENVNYVFDTNLPGYGSAQAARLLGRVPVDNNQGIIYFDADLSNQIEQQMQ